jgi:hypothetical protein
MTTSNVILHSMKTILSSILFLTLALGTAMANDAPINEDCPVCGKAARLIFWSKTREGRVAFATKECKAKFDKAPGSFKVKKADPK